MKKRILALICMLFMLISSFADELPEQATPETVVPEITVQEAPKAAEPAVTEQQKEQPEPAATEQRKEQPEPAAIEQRNEQPEPAVTEQQKEQPEPCEEGPSETVSTDNGQTEPLPAEEPHVEPEDATPAVTDEPEPENTATPEPADENESENESAEAAPAEDTNTDETEEAVPEDTPEPAETEHVDPMKVRLTSNVLSVFASENTMKITVNVTGGKGPYVTEYTAKVAGNAVKSGTTKENKFTVSPKISGKCVIEANVTDSLGNTARGYVTIPVARRDSEPPINWEISVSKAELNGYWPHDIVEIAKTQVGYTESEIDFYIDDTGDRHGYTRYGDWFGTRYAEWCAMFVSFCAQHAGIPSRALPKFGNCEDISIRRGYFYNTRHSYEPKPGDLIFFHNCYSGKKESDERKKVPTHIGIVTGTDKYHVYTIEGNQSHGVRELSYLLDDETIVGYMDMDALFVNYTIIDPEVKEDAPETANTADRTE